MLALALMKRIFMSPRAVLCVALWPLTLPWASHAVAAADAPPRIAALWILEDPPQRLDVTQALSSSDWKPASITGHAGKYSDSAFWVRAELTGQPGQSVVLTMLPSFLDDVRFYIPRASAGKELLNAKGIREISAEWLVSQQGDFFPTSHRAFDWRSFSADLTLPQSGRLEVMLRITSGSTNLIHPELLTREDFLSERKQEVPLFVVMAALTLAAITISFFLYLIYREQVFLIYLFYASFCLAWFVLVNGFGPQLLTITPQLISNLLGFVVCLFLPSGMVFMAQIIDMKHHSPILYRGVLAISAVTALLAPLALLDWYRYFAQEVALAAILQQAAIATTCIRVIASGRLTTRLPILIYLAVIFSNVVLITGFLGALIPPQVTINLLQGIIFLDLMLLLPLAFAKAEHLRKSRERDEFELSRTKAALALEAESNAAYRKWVSMITHEIKTPLSVVDACAQTIRRLSSDPQLVDRIEKIDRATGRIDALVNSFLAEDEIAERSRLIQSTLIPCGQFLDHTLHHLPNVVLDRLQVNPQDRNFQIQVDTELMGVAIRNLVQNAHRHGEGQGRIDLKTELLTRNARPGLAFQVINPGAPIDEINRGMLFERYQRFGDSAGSGLGLWSSREIARAHGGDAWYLRSPSGENIFTLWIPTIR